MSKSVPGSKMFKSSLRLFWYTVLEVVENQLFGAENGNVYIILNLDYDCPHTYIMLFDVLVSISVSSNFLVFFVLHKVQLKKNWKINSCNYDGFSSNLALKFLSGII